MSYYYAKRGGDSGAPEDNLSKFDDLYYVTTTIIKATVLTSTHLSLCLVIPKVTKHLLSNPVFTCIVLAACMEIAVVAGFAAFLGKYLEQQFNLTTTSANQLLGMSDMPPSYSHFACSRVQKFLSSSLKFVQNLYKAN